jgi:hypothetical protein
MKAKLEGSGITRRSGVGGRHFECGGDGLELDERRGEILDDLAGDDLGCRQVVGVLE